MKRLCLRLKRAAGVQAEDVAIPVDTLPGQVAQVDFGFVGWLRDPVARVMRKAWVFVLGGATALNRSYRELAKHYGFKVDPPPTRRKKANGPQAAAPAEAR
jgi:hypothetical protein